MNFKFRKEHFDDVRFHRFDDNITRMRIATKANDLLDMHTTPMMIREIEVCGLTVDQIQECKNFYLTQQGCLPGEET